MGGYKKLVNTKILFMHLKKPPTTKTTGSGLIPSPQNNIEVRVTSWSTPFV
jgi:hypothetical protein